MAATKTLDLDAEKQAKQKKILIVLSIVLVVVLAIQLPRILGGGGSADAAPTADPAAVPTDPAATTADPAVAAVGALTTPVAAQTTPAQLTNGVAPAASETQLASFSLFESKDPFIQQIEVKASDAPGSVGASASTGGGAKPGAKPGGGGASGSASGGGGAVQGKAEEPALAFATISVGGDAESVGLKDAFPKEEPMFVLASLKESSARIGIAGGSLAKGKTVPLVMGKKLTLVNTATGARYTLQLLYTGASPEETATFTSGDEEAAGAPEAGAQTVAGTTAP